MHTRASCYDRRILPGAALLAAAWLLSASLSVFAQTVSSASAPQPVVLDSVIAVVNGDVLLRSDLQTEMELAALQPLSLPPGRNFERRAAQRLINRVLIQQQMNLQGMTKDVSDEEVQKDIAELRKQIPACVQYQCQTEEGWARFLKAHDLDPAEVNRIWRIRMQILGFIDARFQAGIRISKPEIEDYYNKTFAPQFTKQKATPPTLDSVSSRIQEVLLQQRVTVILQDWLKTLREQGNVIILDPALGKSNPASDGEDDGGAE